MTAFPAKSSGADDLGLIFDRRLMQLHEEIQQHLVNLEPNLQAEVLDFVLFLEEKQKKQQPDQRITETQALQIHQQLMSRYADAFAKLAQ